MMRRVREIVDRIRRSLRFEHGNPSGMGFEVRLGTVDPVPDRAAPGESLMERLGAVEFFVDPDVFGNHVAEAVLFARPPA